MADGYCWTASIENGGPFLGFFFRVSLCVVFWLVMIGDGWRQLTNTSPSAVNNQHFFAWWRRIWSSAQPTVTKRQKMDLLFTLTRLNLLKILNYWPFFRLVIMFYYAYYIWYDFWGNFCWFFAIFWCLDYVIDSLICWIIVDPTILYGYNIMCYVLYCILYLIRFLRQFLLIFCDFLVFGLRNWFLNLLNNCGT